MSEDDNRKRGLQDEDDAMNSSKRVAISQGGGEEEIDDNSEPLFFKLLCPQGITGLIIGKGGANIIQLNSTTGARIKLSQNNEYFPNTTDRILLISGAKQGIENAIRELVSRIVEAPEKRQSIGDMGKPQPARPSGSYAIRVLIPKMASAAVIGKGGAVIKRMSEFSNCRYQLGEEQDPFNTNERIVTITGTTSVNVVAGATAIMYQLLDESPRLRTYVNPTTNYSGRNGSSHSNSSQSLPHHAMNQPAASMVAAPNYMAYNPVPTPYMPMQYPGMPQMPVQMQHAMYPQGMQMQPGYHMPPQYHMNNGPPPGYVAGPSHVFAPQFATHSMPPMDMNQMYQQQQQSPHFGPKPVYLSPQMMPMQAPISQQPHPQASQLNGGSPYNGPMHNGAQMK